jgi:hypothetical protein
MPGPPPMPKMHFGADPCRSAPPGTTPKRTALSAFGPSVPVMRTGSSAALVFVPCAVGTRLGNFPTAPVRSYSRRCE